MMAVRADLRARAEQQQDSCTGAQDSIVRGKNIQAVELRSHRNEGSSLPVPAHVGGSDGQPTRSAHSWTRLRLLLRPLHLQVEEGKALRHCPDTCLRGWPQYVVARPSCSTLFLLPARCVCDVGDPPLLPLRREGNVGDACEIFLRRWSQSCVARPAWSTLFLFSDVNIENQRTSSCCRSIAGRIY